jgi:hypothetical protein
MLRFRLGLFLLLALALIVGCHRSQTPAKVTGTVKYKGQPLKGGTITFESDSMGSYNASLSQEGAYEIVDMPAGTMKVIVETESMNPDKKKPNYPGRGAGAAKSAQMDKERAAKEKASGTGGPLSHDEALARYVKIPAKYSNRTATPLKADVTAGRQTVDFDLTD